MTADHTALATWQRVLLQRLGAGDEPDAIRRALLAEPDLAALCDTIAALDDRALHVARALVARWGAGAGEPR